MEGQRVSRYIRLVKPPLIRGLTTPLSRWYLTGFRAERMGHEITLPNIPAEG